MKTLRWLIPIALLVLLLGVGTSVVSATGAEPVGTAYVDNAPHVIPADTTTWYRFEYDGSRSQILVRLINGKDTGVHFQVYTPSEMDEWWKNDGIGMGSPQGDDLLWSGKANEGGTWFVKVINEKAEPKTFTLEVTGEDVSLTPPTPVQPQVPSVVTAPTLNADPSTASIIDTTAAYIPAGETLWYRFAYDGKNDQVDLKVPKGWENRLQMRVYAPSQISKWWSSEVKPVGQGTPRDADLVWSGNSNEPGWWYVELINKNPYGVGFAFETVYPD